jgi:cytochrome c peroxidase
LAQGVFGRLGTRNSPSLSNATFTSAQFWDGRRISLESQVGDPFINPAEHGLRSHSHLLQLIRKDSNYLAKFRDAFGIDRQDIGLTQVSQALSTYLRTLPRGNSAFDRFQYGHDAGALSHAARRGFELFKGRARCDSCHSIGAGGASFTDEGFHALGVGLAPVRKSLASLALKVERLPARELDSLVLQDRDVAALGRFVVTKDPNDIGKFKTPSLRNVALTAPYMHDGSVPTLEAAVDQEAYYRGLEAGRPLILTPAEKADLVAFLKALSGLNGAKAD